MASNQTIDLMNMVTTGLNSFFGQISYKNYQFENTTSAKKDEQDRKQKLIRKAFRIYKKKQVGQIASDLTEKQKDKLITKSWQKLSDDEKIKYLEAPSKVSDKKSKKKKDDDNFRPGTDE